MSQVRKGWGIGDNHDSDEVTALKKKILSQDAENTTLQSQLFKKDKELQEMKDSWNDALCKLRNEADRACRLEASLKQRNEELMNERTAGQNATAAAAATERKLKAAEQNVLQLESTLDSLSSHANASSAGKSKLEQDNMALQQRVRSLEADLRSTSRSEQALRQSQTAASASARGRRRSSSTSSLRVTALEQQLADLRSNSQKHALELQKTAEQLVHAKGALVQMENEKMAAERGLNRRIQELQSTIEDQQEELSMLRDTNAGQDAAEREANLLERLEHEEQRVRDLETALNRSASGRKGELVMVQKELERTMQLLDEANTKVAKHEVDLATLLRERQAAVGEKDSLRMKHAGVIRELQTASAKISQLEARVANPELNADEVTAATVERLLGAIDRLRDERDGLRRDLEFLNTENRFAVQSLEAKLAIASAPVTPMTATFDLPTPAGPSRTDIRRSERTALALSLVAQHAGARVEEIDAHAEALELELVNARSHTHQAQQAIAEYQRLFQETEEKMSCTTTALDAARAEVSGLQVVVQRLENELAKERESHVETGAALSDVESRLDEASRALTEAEAQRDSLALEKNHLEHDLQVARQEAEEADERLGQHYAATTSDRAAEALRTQVRALEERIQRRTQQIGEHQHDIKRLDMNLRLQEDRIAEMTAELELAQAQKAAMVEDCETTREERDAALARCDEVEEAMDAMETCREREVLAMVEVSVSSLAARRDADGRFGRLLATYQEDRAHLETRIHAVDHERSMLADQVAALSREREHVRGSLDGHATSMQSLRNERDNALEDARQATLALSASQAEVQRISAAVQAAEDAKVTVVSQLQSLQLQLDEKTNELTTLQTQLEAAAQRHAEEKSRDEETFGQIKASLSSELHEVRTSRDDLEYRLRTTTERLEHVEGELRRVEEDLARQLSENTDRSDEEVRLRDALAQAKGEHEERVTQLQSQMDDVKSQLAQGQQERRDAEVAAKALEEELQQAKDQLEAKQAEAAAALESAGRLQEELEQLKASQSQTVTQLENELREVSKELEETTVLREELKDLHTHITETLARRTEEASDARLKVEELEGELAILQDSQTTELQTLEARLQDRDAELKMAQETQSSLEESVDELTRTVEELQRHLQSATKEADEYKEELAAEQKGRDLTSKALSQELSEAIKKRDEAEAALERMLEELPAVRAQLAHTESSLRELEEEKLNLQYQTTNLEADVQRSKSHVRFLESQLADSEQNVKALEQDVGELRAKCGSLETLCKTTEANLSMQSIQHEQTLANLRRELNTLRSSPSLQETVAELQEKNEQMEEMLRNKCLEIEENDDKFIDMLKEKKKLNSKIESLTRKVQSLQTKLAAAKEAAPSPVAEPIAPPTSHSDAHPPASSRARPHVPTVIPEPPRSTSRARVITAPVPSSSTPHSQQTPRMPVYRPTTPESRSRFVSGPSGITRPKTPESRSHPPVFKARTPEHRRMTPESRSASSMPESSSSSSVLGVKRRAPDDFDDCEAVPPQGFTTESVPDAQPTTPRFRKALQNVRSGFTPSRRSAAAPTSPVRRATTGTAFPPTISDVTNSPGRSRTETAPAAKRGWLGKIKSVPPQPARSGMLRQPVFEPPRR